MHSVISANAFSFPARSAESEKRVSSVRSCSFVVRFRCESYYADNTAVCKQQWSDAEQSRPRYHRCGRHCLQASSPSDSVQTLSATHVILKSPTNTSTNSACSSYVRFSISLFAYSFILCAIVVRCLSAVVARCCVEMMIFSAARVPKSHSDFGNDRTRLGLLLVVAVTSVLYLISAIFYIANYAKRIVFLLV